MNNFAPYQPATGCERYGPQGAQALTTYTEDVFAALHRSLGICNCRPVRGGASWSHHAECRAADSGFTIVRNVPWGYLFALILAKHGKRLGIDHIITNARPWESGRGRPIVFSARSVNGRVYTGAHPHKDHNHTGFTRSAGRNLTYGTLVAVLGTPEEVARQLGLVAIPPPPKPPPTTDWTKELIMALPTLKEGDGYTSKGTAAKRPDVKRVQGLLIANGFEDKNSSRPKTGVDGVFGPGTDAAVRRFQSSARIGVDGIVGKNTWTKLLGE